MIRCVASALSALALLCLFVFPVARGGEEGLRNGSLQVDTDGVPTGWEKATGLFTYAAFSGDFPEGLSHGFTATVTGQHDAQGFIRQRLPVPQGVKAFVLEGWLRSDLPGGAFFQVILLKDNKELRRVNSLVSRTQWDRVAMTVPVAGADSLYVLCRWSADAKAIGKTSSFAGLSWRKADCYIALAGDSIVKSYPLEGNLRGWGETLGQCFKSGVAIFNYAEGGRSTKSFRLEKRWQALLDTRPDFVFIQFGHNDSHAPGRPESTNAATEYRDNLVLYVKEARAAGIVPLLVTPPHRRTFADGAPTTELLAYAEAMRSVAAELSVPLIDLHADSEAWLKRIGDKPAEPFFVNEKDRTHFSLSGAQTMAGMIAATLPKVCPDLAAWLAPTDGK